MGFLDKARRMADQAQQKLDEAQQRFNDSQRERAAAARAGEQAPVVQYDSAGRPIEPAPPAAAPVVQIPAAPPHAGIGANDQLARQAALRQLLLLGAALATLVGAVSLGRVLALRRHGQHGTRSE
jgi:hypothetical protein